MKQLFTTLFLAISITVSGQIRHYKLADMYPEPKYRTDTTYGVLVVVAISYDAIESSHVVGCVSGFKIDSIGSYFGGIPCPNGRDGMYCEGWTDIIRSTTYLNSEYGIIDPKCIIKFIPK